MSDSPGINVGQTRLSAGHRSATSAAGHFTAPRQLGRGRKSGVLYALAAIEDDPNEIIARTIVETVGRTFQSTSGSLTARLRRAVQAGSAALLQENLDVVSRSPRSGGVACAVLRGDDLYMAQAGTTVACICRRGALDRLPDSDPDEPSGRAFGRRHDPDVRLTYHTVKPGDSVMLADAGLVKQASDDILAQALSFADAGPSLDSLAQSLPTGEGAILVLATPGRSSTPVPVPSAVPAVGLPGERPSAVPGEPPEIAVDPSDYTRPEHDQRAQDRSFRPPAPASPAVGERLTSIREAAGKGLAAMGRVASDWFRRLMPGDRGPYRGLRRPTDRELRRQTDSTDYPIWRPIALILPVIVVLLVAGTYWKKGWDRQARYDQLMAEVEKQLEIAATADKVISRQALETALSTLEEAAEIPAHQEAISMLQADVQKQLDTLNKAVRLDHVEHLHTYPPIGEVDQIVVHGADIYVLDRLTDRVYYHRLNEAGTALESDEETLLVRKGDQPDAAAVVGELVGMTWMPSGEGRQTGALFLLGRNGLLLAHDPTWERQVGTMLPASETWQYPVDVSSYMGRFYVLDPGLRQVLRYRASGAGFDSPPEKYFAEGKEDMAGAIDMAIDGFIYLLFEDGRLEKYLSGEPVPLTLNLAGQSLQQPSAIYTAPDAGVQFLYVADPSASRVLRCDKDGRLIQQFVLQDNDALSHVRDIFVDEVGSRLFFLSSNRLFVANIPPP